MPLKSNDLGHSSPSFDRRRATSPKLARVFSGDMKRLPSGTSRPANHPSVPNPDPMGRAVGARRIEGRTQHPCL